MHKVRLFNAKFSPNLGDGLLSECLEHALIQNGADVDTWSIDLAGRREYGDEMAGRAAIMAVLDRMPAPIRRNFIRIPLAIKSERSWRPHYRDLLRGADAVVIGGGNLLSDMDLNFPTKLALAVEEAERRNLPTFVYAAGVASSWSQRGERMVRDAFRKPCVKGIFVRDVESKVHWDSRFGEETGHSAVVVRDPGLLAQPVYEPQRKPIQKRESGAQPIVGLGIMSHVAIRYHSADAPGRERLDNWYIDVAKRVVEQGCQLRIFTNGSPEDRVYAESLLDRFRALGAESVLTFPQSSNPRELCEIIGNLDVLIAYRMHAVIAAYSYGVPSIALTWDQKLASFMKSVGREKWLLDVNKISAADCVDLALQAEREGIPDADRLQTIDEARDGVSQLYSLMAEHLE